MFVTKSSETAVLWAGPGVESAVLQGFHQVTLVLWVKNKVFQSFVFSFFHFLIFFNFLIFFIFLNGEVGH